MMDFFKRINLLFFVICLLALGYAVADAPLNQVNQMESSTEKVASNDQKEVDVVVDEEEDDDLDDEKLLELAKAEINEILGQDNEEKKA